MIESPDPKPSVEIEHKTSEWRSPHVVLPIVAAMTTIFVAIIGVIPALIEANKPPALTPTPIVIAITATAQPTNTSIPALAVSTDVPAAPPTNTPTDLPPTDTPTDLPATAVPTLVSTDLPATLAPTLAPTDTPPTSAPTDPVIVDAAPTVAPNVTLFYDQDSFTILNGSGSRISLDGLVFRGETVAWDIAPFGGLMKALPNNKCLRLRDATVGNRTPPSECGSQMYGFLEIGPTAIFWRGTQFEVVHDDNVIATCEVAAKTCPIYVGP